MQAKDFTTQHTLTFLSNKSNFSKQPIFLLTNNMGLTGEDFIALYRITRGQAVSGTFRESAAISATGANNAISGDVNTRYEYDAQQNPVRHKESEVNMHDLVRDYRITDADKDALIQFINTPNVRFTNIKILYIGCNILFIIHIIYGPECAIRSNNIILLKTDFFITFF